MPRSVTWIGVAPAVLAAVIVSGCAEPATPKTAEPATKADTPSSTHGNQPTEAEKNYFGAAVSYLQAAHKQGMNVARKMGGATDGSSTLTDIKDALSRAMSVERIGYEVDYRNRIKANIPPGWSDIAANIDRTHQLFQAGMKEYLEYWKDQNTAHIVSGEKTLTLSVKLMNQTIENLNTKMEKFTPPK